MEKANLGELLVYAQRHEILTHPVQDHHKKTFGFSYNDRFVSIGCFNMQAYNHDTGIDAAVFICAESKTPYCILNGTYWKISGYSHNKFHRENGAWDKAFNEAISKLRTEIDLHKKKKEAEKQRIINEKINASLSHKNEIESLFQNS